MAPIKTTAIIINTQAYRESSVLVSLLNREQGLIRGIAKGIRGNKRGSLWLCRGEVVELLVYGHGSHTLHTLGSIAVAKSYPSTAAVLEKTALRDVALEIALRCIHESESHPELYSVYEELLEEIEALPANQSFPFLIWPFIFSFLNLLGFGVDLDRCGECGGGWEGTTGGNLVAERGGVICDRCARPDPGHAFLPKELFPVLKMGTAFGSSHDAVLQTLSAVERCRITRLAVSCCLYLCDARSELNSLAFVNDLIG